MKRTIILMLTLCMGCGNQAHQDRAAADSTRADHEEPALSAPEKEEYLPDSTHVWYMKQGRVQLSSSFLKTGELKVSGDIFLETKPGGRPLLIHTHLLDLRVAGGSGVWLSVPETDPWGEIKVLKGTIIAKKTYTSSYPAPDTVRGGQLLMINQDVDIMEKEDDSLEALKAWRTSLR